MHKVCIVSPVHNTSDIRIFKKQFTSLVNRGFKVSVICRADMIYAKSTKGVKITALDYSNRFLRFLHIPKIIYMALKDNADVYHIHNPDTLPVGIVLKLFGRKVIYDTHENFRKKILLRKWIPSLIRATIANMVFYGEKACSHLFNATIVTQEEQKKDYKRSCLIGNSPILPKRHSLLNKSLEKDVLRLVYVGGISEDRGLSHMLRLCSLMNEVHPTELTLIGPAINSLTNEKLLELVSKTSNVIYKGTLAQSEAFEIVKGSHYGLILLDDVADYRETSPNKLFEYMMLGTPFIATNFDKWQSLLGSINAGFFVTPSTLNLQIAKKIAQAWLDDDNYKALSTEGAGFICNTYNWELTDEPKLLKLYEEVLK